VLLCEFFREVTLELDFGKIFLILCQTLPYKLSCLLYNFITNTTIMAAKYNSMRFT